MDQRKKHAQSDYRQGFVPLSKIKVHYVKFHTRQDRILYVFNQFKPYLHTKILDVGCDEGFLKRYLTGTPYTGIDIADAADMQVNLEKIDRLPFTDRSYECVLCTDVLEHLDNLHAVFFELLRVADRTIIISWPNNWVNARRPLERGAGTFEHYGLPSENPCTRHKWFFNISDARCFLYSSLQKHPEWHLAEEFITEKPRLTILRLIRRLRYPNREKYWNRYAHTYWTVLKRD